MQKKKKKKKRKEKKKEKKERKKKSPPPPTKGILYIAFMKTMLFTITCTIQCASVLTGTVSEYILCSFNVESMCGPKI